MVSNKMDTYNMELRGERESTLCGSKWLYELLNKQQEMIAHLAETVNNECEKNRILVDKSNLFESETRNISDQLELITAIFKQFCDVHTINVNASSVKKDQADRRDSLSSGCSLSSDIARPFEVDQADRRDSLSPSCSLSSETIGMDDFETKIWQDLEKILEDSLSVTAAETDGALNSKNVSANEEFLLLDELTNTSSETEYNMCK